MNALIVLCLLPIVFFLLVITLQDFLIFPKLRSGKRSQVIPEGVLQHFLRVDSDVELELWEFGGGKPVLLIHGNGDTVDSYFWFQKKCAGLGLNTFCYDFRGIGDSGGWPSEGALCSDVMSVLRFISERSGVPESDIPVLALSIGTGPGCYAFRHAKLKQLFLFAPFINLPEVIKGLPWKKNFFRWSWYILPNLKHLLLGLEQESEGREITIFHGDKDTVVPVEHGRSIAESIAERFEGAVTMFELAGVGHSELQRRAWNKISEKLRQYVV